VNHQQNKIDIDIDPYQYKIVDQVI